MYSINAHDQEISCLDFIEYTDTEILATGSKDTLSHIFDCN
jgi:WD40 repeat protein